MVVIVALLYSTAPAGAAVGKHLFKKVFGSVAQPTFTTPRSLAVDQETGDVLVADTGANEKQEVKIEAGSGLGGTLQLTLGGQTTGWSGQGMLNGTTSVTGVTTSTGNLSKGEEVSGTGIAAGTTISSLTATTITLSKVATGTGAQNLAANLPYGSTGGVIREALEKFSNVGAGNVTVTGSGSISPVIRTVEFTNELGGENIESMSCSGAGLTGTSPGCAITTLANGVPYGISRFTHEGAPANFSGLGTNVIDGKRGPGSKVCGEEPASCDEVPQHYLAFPTNPAQMQIAVDNSGPGSLTDGDIYVTQFKTDLVDVFASNGDYLGQLTTYNVNDKQKITFSGIKSGSQFILSNLPASCIASSTGPITYTEGETGGENITNALAAVCGKNFADESISSRGTTEVEFSGALGAVVQPQLGCTVTSGTGSCSVIVTTVGGTPQSLSQISGAAVGPNGTVYLGDFGFSVHLFNPVANPVVNGNSSRNFRFTPNMGNVAAGIGSSAGYLFPMTAEGQAFKINGITGVIEYTVASGAHTTETMNPDNGDLLVASSSGAAEYDVAEALSAPTVSTLTASSKVEGIAVDGATGSVYLSREGGTQVEVFGQVEYPPVTKAFAPINVNVTEATLEGSVNAQSTVILACRFEYISDTKYKENETSHLEGFTGAASANCAQPVPGDSNAHPVSAGIDGLAPNTTYHVRLKAENEVAPEVSSAITFTTETTVKTGGASGIAATEATVNGSVNPNGAAVTGCKFEYLTEQESIENARETSAGFTGAHSPATASCTPAAGAIEADFRSHTVEAKLPKLGMTTAYYYRLSVTSGSGTLLGMIAKFTTLGKPIIGETVALWAGQTTATLQATIDPDGFGTNYYFEWGTEGHYEHRIPADSESFAGEGDSNVAVSVNVSGLTEAGEYQYRVVADNARGTTVGGYGTFETLDSCGLPDNRCYELVSPPDKGPAGVVTIQYGSGGGFKVGPGGGSVVFPYLNPVEATAGGGLSYLAKRSVSGWSSTQLNPPSLVSTPQAGTLQGQEAPGSVVFTSPDLSCSIVRSYGPLTNDVPVIDTEFGARNLFSRDAEGNWHLITTPIPSNLPEKATLNSGFFNVYGASPDCGRVYFSSVYKYLPSPTGLYESDNGTIRDAGLLPDGSKPASATGNAVSEDGAKLFFSAPSDKLATSGKQAVFVREGGSSVEVTEKQGGANNSLGSRFALASIDGSHVFFISTYGLAPASSAGTAEACGSFTAGEEKACDVYDYDTETGHLTDLSADTNVADAKGAVAQQVLSASAGGGLVYFTAMGQLIPGKGRTYAENTAPPSAGARTVNVYLSEEGTLHYVMTVVVGALGSAKASPDGRHLLFTSAENITGYESGGASEAYLYSAAGGGIQCVSCRRDGQPASGVGGGSVGPPTLSEDGSRVFFVSRDALAPGAVQGNNNVYEWKRGQVFLLVAGQGKETFNAAEYLFGASPSGNDVFFGTSARLVSQDVDSVADLYDARVGGGFPPPESAPESCNPEVNCQGEALVAPLASNPASAAFSGPGNQPAVQAPAVKPKTTVKLLTRAQKLDRALKACRAKPKKQRVVCDKQAEKRYGTQKRKHPASKAQGKTMTSSGRGK